MGYLYQNRSWLTKISLIAFSLFFSLYFSSSSLAAEKINLTKIVGTKAVSTISTTVGGTSVFIQGQATNPQSELLKASFKIRIGKKDSGVFAESDFLNEDIAGNFQLKVENLSPETEYVFQVFDNTSYLAPSDFYTFTTKIVQGIEATLEVETFEDDARIIGFLNYPDLLTLAPELAPLRFVIAYGPIKPDGKNDFAEKTDLIEFSNKPEELGRFEISLYDPEGFSEPLKPDTAYQFRIVDTNGNFKPSPISNFRTIGENTLKASSQVAIIDANKVEISGLISSKNPANGMYKIQYGVENLTYEIEIPKVDLAGNFFDVPIVGLSPGITYRYRIVDATDKLLPAPESTFNTSATARGGMGSNGDGLSVAGEGGTNPSTGPKPATSGIGLSKLPNPLGGINTLAGFVKKVLDIVLMIGVPIIAIFIIYSGFLFVKARGNEKELETAKSTFLWTVVGAAILLASWILALAICQTVVKLGETGTTTQCQ